MPVVEGGTGAQTLTAHSILLGEGTSAISSVGPGSVSGVPLIAQGSSSDPAFGIANVVGGGTGGSTFTAYSLITAGTTSTASFQNVSGVGTSGQILTSNGASALPTWQAVPASSISITGDSGGALVGAAFTFTGGASGLTFAGAGSTETLGGTLNVAHGGTGDNSFTAYAVIAGGTTSTGVLQSVSGVGTSGQVLTSNGASALPTWQTASAGGIVTLDGDSGSATGSTVTLTGSTTGLTFTGSGATVTLGGDLVVANGGTGNTTFTAYSLIAAGTTATGAFQHVSGLGAAGQILTSNGAAALPTWQSGAGATISITGDSGGAITSGSFTFTGGTTGLTFAGAGTTETLTGTLIVGNGGTGRATLTNHGVLVGAGTGAITQLAVGTTGQVLTGATGADPVWASPAASSISITGDSGGALIGAAFTFTGGTTGLTFAGAGSTETLGGDLIVANGGTGRTTLTNHGVLVGAGTGAITQLAVGTTGQVLTGATGADPVWASPAASSISITGDSGGALTGNSFTFTGGSTGLTFAGAGSTETLGGDLVVANGGTGNTTFTAYSVLCAGTTATGAFQNVSGLGSSGNVLTSNGAGALPTWQAAGASFVWSVITANQNAAVNNGYIANKASNLVLTLPTTAAVGTLIEITGMNTALGWTIAQNVGQQIFFGTSTTTSGTGGSLSSSNIYDAVRLVCNVANTSWIVISSIGNITVV
jgi:hypothetical protein